MNARTQVENPPKSQLMLHRIYVKNCSFESSATTLASIQNPAQPTIDMQVFANVYAQENNVREAILGLKITAKHNGNVLWKVQLEEAGLYTLEGLSEEHQNDILNGFSMNQLYSHAGVVVTQMVVQAGFLPIYLQPMDFMQMYQQQKKEKVQESPIEDLNFKEKLSVLEANLN